MLAVNLVNGVAPSVTVMPASDAGSSAAGARSVIAAVSDWPGSLIAGVGMNASGSTVKWNAAVSPAVQPAVMSPSGGAQTWLPSLSTTLGANATLQSLP